MRSARLAAVAVTGAAAAVVALPAAPAAAKTTTCKPGRYQLVLPGSIPAVSKLRAIDLPRLTDGYAPRCLVAEAVAVEIQRGFEGRSRLPRKVIVLGARWNGGTWHCTYAKSGTDRRGSCRKVAHRSQRVKLTLSL